MTLVVRDIPAGVLTEIQSEHTQAFHIVKIQFSLETVFLSEGPEYTHESNVYAEGMVRVSNLSWTGEGAQTCTLEILNDNNYAAALFLANKVADAEVTIWTVHEKADGLYTDPVLYVKGSADSSELVRDKVSITLVTSAVKTKHFPNQYMGTAGFSYIPAEGTVVFWNATTYVLERDYG